MYFSQFQYKKAEHVIPVFLDVHEQFIIGFKYSNVDTEIIMLKSPVQNNM